MNEIQKLYKYLPSDIGNIDWDLVKNEILKPYVLKMKETKQEFKWHQEGDVLTHTIMVCEELIKLEEYKSLDQKRRLELFFSAMFHDVGKTVCTKVEDGIIRSPHHGPTGSLMIREYLWKEFGLSGNEEYQNFRETICLLIKYHGSTVYLNSENDIRKIIKISRNQKLAKDFNLKMLYILSKADILGRISYDTKNQLNCLKKFRSLAIELNCYDNVFNFGNDYTKFEYLSGTNVWHGQTLYDSTWREVILLAGLPGTGKDTYIKNNFSHMPVISLDKIRDELDIDPSDNQGAVYNYAKEKAQEYLRSRISFIWNATNLTTLIRQKQIKLFHDYHAKVRIIFLETSWSENLSRNKSRKKEVNSEIIEKMLRNLNIPEDYEAEIVEWVCL